MKKLITKILLLAGLGSALVACGKTTTPQDITQNPIYKQGYAAGHKEALAEKAAAKEKIREMQKTCEQRIIDEINKIKEYYGIPKGGSQCDFRYPEKKKEMHPVIKYVSQKIFEDEYLLSFEQPGLVGITFTKDCAEAEKNMNSEILRDSNQPDCKYKCDFVYSQITNTWELSLERQYDEMPIKKIYFQGQGQQLTQGEIQKISIAKFEEGLEKKVEADLAKKHSYMTLFEDAKRILTEMAQKQYKKFDFFND